MKSSNYIPSSGALLEKKLKKKYMMTKILIVYERFLVWKDEGRYEPIWLESVSEICEIMRLC